MSKQMVAGLFPNKIFDPIAAEISVMFENIMIGVIVQRILLDLGHKQLSTPVRTNNTTSHGIVYDTIKQIWSHTIYIRFHFIRNCML